MRRMTYTHRGDNGENDLYTEETMRRMTYTYSGDDEENDLYTQRRR